MEKLKKQLEALITEIVEKIIAIVVSMFNKAGKFSPSA